MSSFLNQRIFKFKQLDTSSNNYSEPLRRMPQPASVRALRLRGNHIRVLRALSTPQLKFRRSRYFVCVKRVRLLVFFYSFFRALQRPFLYRVLWINSSRLRVACFRGARARRCPSLMASSAVAQSGRGLWHVFGRFRRRSHGSPFPCHCSRQRILCSPATSIAIPI